MASEHYLYGNAGDMALLGSVMRGQGIPARDITRWWGRYGATPGIAFPSSHAERVTQILKENGKHSAVKISTAGEYRKRQIRFILAIVLPLLIATAILYWGKPQ